MTAADEMLLGEDECGIEKHICIIQEMRKNNADITILEDSMKRTAAHRQKLCHNNSVVDVQSTFPCSTAVKTICKFSFTVL